MTSRHPLTVHDKNLWIKCAGNIPFDPSIDALVYYFPNGDVYNIGKSEDRAFSDHLKFVYHSAYLCRILSISFLADDEYEEVFAKIRLKTVDGNPNQIVEAYEREQVIDGFFMKTLTSTDVRKGLRLPIPSSNENGAFPSHDPKSSMEITLTDFGNKPWQVRHICHTVKENSCSLGSGWTEFAKSKKLTTGDTVIFKKNTESAAISVGFRRKHNPSAKKYVSLVNDYAMEGVVLSSAQRAHTGDEFDVIYFPHWIDYLVHPSILIQSKSKLAKGMRIKKSNPQRAGGTGVNVLGGTLLELNESNDLTWNAIKIHWDGEGIPVYVNPWEIQPWQIQPLP